MLYYIAKHNYIKTYKYFIAQRKLFFVFYLRVTILHRDG